MRRKGLGRGLSDLLSGDTLAQSRAVIEVALDDIEPNPLQPRQGMDDSSLEELTLRDGVLRMRLAADRQGSAGPRDVLAALGLDDLERAAVRLRRTRVEVEP